jgi:uncharacterized damage-inducible protein DinB
MNRPLENEHAAYYQKYINKVDTTDIAGLLVKQHKEIQDIFSTLNDKNSLFAYAEGKWSIKELLGHMLDSERVFSYRICIARGEQQSLPGFDQDEFVLHANFNQRPVISLKDEYNFLQLANIELIKSLSDEEISRKGTASNNPVTVRALLFILAGHEKHHLEIFNERYAGKY